MDVLLTTPRLTLRRFTMADADHLVDLYNDPEVMRFINGGRPIPRASIEQETLPRFLRSYERYGGLGYWAAEQRPSGAFLGWFELVPVDESPDEVELGYRLIRECWGHGYATEGSRALVAKAFHELGVRRVVASTMAVNRASRRVMEKTGLHWVETAHRVWAEPIAGIEQGEVYYEATADTWH